MSENTVKDVKEKTKGSWLTNFLWAVVGAIIGIVLGYAVFTATLKDTASDAIDAIQSTEEAVEDAGDASNSISTYVYEHTVLGGDELTAAVDDISNRILNLMNKNTYMQIQVGENEYEAYVYNKHGECFAQDSNDNYSAIFRDDKKVVKYTNADSALAIGTDIDLLNITLNAVKAPLTDIEDASARLLRMEFEEESDIIEYRVDLVGDNAVRECYTSLGLNFADSMVANLKSQLTDWEPHLIFVYLVDTKSDDISMHCYYVADDAEYTNWVMQAYVEVDDWKLDDSWYTIDVNAIEIEEFTSMLETETVKISKLLDKIIENADTDGNLDENDDNAENTEVVN